MPEGIAAFLPRVSQETRPFWEGVKAGQLRTRRCRPCGELFFPPRVVCPFCFGQDLEWAPLSGRDTLYAFTRMWVVPEPFRSKAPYVVGLVDLAEGLRVFGKIRGRYEDLAIGAPVVFERELLAADVYLFAFRPEGGQGRDG